MTGTGESIAQAEHLVSSDSARSINGGKIVITVNGKEIVKTWDEAWSLAQKIIGALELGKRDA